MQSKAENARELLTDAAIRTARLSLVPPLVEHAPVLYPLLNDWDVLKNLSEVPWPLRYEDVANFLASMPNTSADDFVLFSEDSPIGVVAVKKPGSGDPPRKMPRLGYWIGKRYWGRGYGTEAIGALVDYAFRTYSNERVGAGIFHDNPASRRVLEKLGFSAVGAKTAISRSRDGEVATIDMQITRAEWAYTKARRR